MQQSLEMYRSFGRRCAYAHRIKDVPVAAGLFKAVWHYLDAETLDDHCEARREFNDAFAYAYRSKWTPDDDTPALARAVGVSAVKSAVAPAPAPAVRYVAPRVIRNRCDPKGNPRKSVALDCAAFFANKSA